MTHALFLGSPGLDAGDDSACPPIDQRGILRPGGAACDIGAFESPKGAVERGKYCGDRLDNDRDGKIDCEDEDCADGKLCE